MTKPVLIVEDDQMQRHMLATLLKRKLSFNAYEAQHGRKALEILEQDKEQTIKLIILDLNMPVMGGIETLEALQQKHPNIPVIMLTGSKNIEDAVEAMKLGAVDFIINYGNIFSGSGMGGSGTKSQDDFLDDLSSYVDPRYNDSQATLFFCNTAVYNWLHKLSGYFKNNLEVSSNFSADMSLTSKKKVFGVDISQISTVYGDMNVARNIHLDGSSVKMLGINMKNCAYRPLVGNGVNRDTSVYVGVQTLENSGVDRRVDQILTEAGMEWSMAESHAIWT